jgi:hypothetical protein
MSRGKRIRPKSSELPPDRLGGLIVVCFWLIQSGTNPSGFEPRAWYDRTIRIVGGILLLIVFGCGIILTIIDLFKK